MPLAPPRFEDCGGRPPPLAVRAVPIRPIEATPKTAE
jgi:hypothetical protein